LAIAIGLLECRLQGSRSRAAEHYDLKIIMLVGEKIHNLQDTCDFLTRAYYAL
jgi:hypothetical protein